MTGEQIIKKLNKEFPDKKYMSFTIEICRHVYLNKQCPKYEVRLYHENYGSVGGTSLGNCIRKMKQKIKDAKSKTKIMFVPSVTVSKEIN